MAVEQHAVERGVGAEDRDLLALAEATVDADAGDVRQRFGDVAVGELANILSGDDVDDGVGVALHRDRLLQRPAIPGDDDVVCCAILRIGGLGRGRRGGRRVLRLGGAGDADDRGGHEEQVA